MGAVGGGLGIIGLLITLLLGGNVLGDDGSGGGSAGTQSNATPDEMSQYIEDLVGEVQVFWRDEFQRNGRQYEQTTLVRFEQQVQTGCGLASSQTGPFYCPPDRKVYIDLGFFRELSDRFGAPGDFAQGYVVAHEFGHHVQTILDLPHPQNNEASVRYELQADCLAGIWGRSMAERNALDPGDTEEGIAAAASVGDDRIQEQVQGRVDPESFTHGTSEQRVAAFQHGFQGGELRSCVNT
jgi:predicted metalloprotease